MRGRELGARLRERDLTAAPAVLNLIESRTADAREQARALLAELSPAALGHEAPGHIVGVTGPPGVGKSSLLSRLAAEWRARGRSVAVLAVDPSSRRSGGSLLGDRARIDVDPRDRQVFIRSTAAGDRLGGLAPATRSAAAALAVAFDVVVIETVGVGQSEVEVADVADTVAVVIQPASGDVLQFLKAGIMEVPDVLVLTKADLTGAARRATADLQAALTMLGASDTKLCPVSSVPPPTGIAELVDALDAHRSGLDLTARRLEARRRHALDEFVAEHGERGVRALGGRLEAGRWLAAQDPALDVRSLLHALESRAAEERPVRSVRRRFATGPRRILLPGDPLVDGPTALRAWRDSDLEPLVVACQDPEISRWTRVPYPYGATDARAYLLQRHDTLHAGIAAPFAIVSSADRDQLLGSISLMRFAWQHARAEVGYWLAEPARRQGHASRAVRLISAWGFRTLGLQRIDLMAATGNPDSQRVAERCGFTREAVLRSYLQAKHDRQDMVAFGLLASDPRSF